MSNLDKNEPQSRMETYLNACIDGVGENGLPTPQSRVDTLLIKLVEKLSSGSGGGGGTKLYKHTLGIVYIISASSTKIPNTNATSVLYSAISAKYMRYTILGINQTGQYSYTVQYWEPLKSQVLSTTIDLTNEVDEVTEL